MLTTPATAKNAASPAASGGAFRFNNLEVLNEATPAKTSHYRRRIRENRKAPADPTTARIAVGFSGEFTHPPGPCACTGSVIRNKKAEPASINEAFLMVSSRCKVLTSLSDVNEKYR